jgi:hypothetical protein
MGFASKYGHELEIAFANNARIPSDEFLHDSFKRLTSADLPSPISKKIALRLALVEALDLRYLLHRFARNCPAPDSSNRVVTTSQRGAVIFQTIKRRIPAYTPPPPRDPPTWSARPHAGSAR